jgi:hypothetical protein
MLLLLFTRDEHLRLPSKNIKGQCLEQLDVITLRLQLAADSPPASKQPLVPHAPFFSMPLSWSSASWHRTRHLVAVLLFCTSSS